MDEPRWTPAPAPEPVPPSAPSPFGEERKSLLRRIGSAIAAFAVLVFNFAAKAKAVLLFLPKIKLLATSGSMLVSVAAYSLFWGWKFAFGFVILLLVHEMGHVIALRREGIQASAPMFIPFLGAFIGAKSLGEDALAEARVGLAGPILGSLGALACVGINAITGNDFWLALAFVGFFLNLFNLLPVLPLDGGRAMAALSPWMWVVGFGLLLGVAIAYPNPIIFLILFLGGMETWRRFQIHRKGGDETQAYYRVSKRGRLAVAVVYVGLAIALVLGMDATHVARTIGDSRFGT